MSDQQSERPSQEWRPSNFFALIIGIDEYQEHTIPLLNGAVSDAADIQRYLEDDLHVPRTNIRALHNTAATRANILQNFKDLESDARIRKGDPILFYFAGHGATGNPPRRKNSGSANQTEDVVEEILPYDFPVAYAIPDRTLGMLLQRLANAKRDNITVILDCCHSGSGTRHAAAHGQRPVSETRGIGHRDIPLPDGLDEDLWRSVPSPEATRGIGVSPGQTYAGLRSHVLMAACGRNQEAREKDKKGVFTAALLEVLRGMPVDQITYEEVINSINLPATDQKPQCEGPNKGRILFNAHIRSDSQPYHRATRNKAGQWIMSVGAAYGISESAEFAVYKDNSWPPEETSKLGTLNADIVSADSTVLKRQSSGNTWALEEAFVLQTRAGSEQDLHLLIQPPGDPQLKQLIDSVHAKHWGTVGQRRLHLCSDTGAAQFIVTLEDKKNVRFGFLDHRLRKHGLFHVDIAVKPLVEEVYPITRAAAHFYWHLRRSSPQGKNGKLRSKVKLELVEVFADNNDIDDDSLLPVLKPVHPYRAYGIVDGEIVIDVPPQSETASAAMYGVKITNTSGIPMHVNAFVFDPVDLSIESWYENGHAGTELALPCQRELTIGYGAAGAVPYSFFLRDERREVEVMLLKVFLSTAPVDLSHVKQKSPVSGAPRAGKPEPQERASVFDTLVVPIVQRLKVT